MIALDYSSMNPKHGIFHKALNLYSRSKTSGIQSRTHAHTHSLNSPTIHAAAYRTSHTPSLVLLITSTFMLSRIVAICFTEKGLTSFTRIVTSNIWEAMSLPCLVLSNLVNSTRTVMYLVGGVEEGREVRGRDGRVCKVTKLYDCALDCVCMCVSACVRACACMCLSVFECVCVCMCVCECWHINKILTAHTYTVMRIPVHMLEFMCVCKYTYIQYIGTVGRCIHCCVHVPNVLSTVPFKVGDELVVGLTAHLYHLADDLVTVD